MPPVQEIFTDNFLLIKAYLVRQLQAKYLKVFG